MSREMKMGGGRCCDLWAVKVCGYLFCLYCVLDGVEMYLWLVCFDFFYASGAHAVFSLFSPSLFHYLCSLIQLPS